MRLPPKEAFYSKLNMRGISSHDYIHAQRVWKALNIINLGEYHDLYLETDVLLLSNVFGAFRNTCLKHYSLDPAHSIRRLDCLGLKKTGIKLELLTDPDMLLMFERGIRGGITQAVHRYVKASNKYTGNPKEESSFLQYLDAKHLYVWAMSQLLLIEGFNWVDPSQFTPDQIDSYANWDREGYLLEADVKYPKKLHDLHDDLPFMCEKKVINKVEKLVPNLQDKKNYVVHIKASSHALKHGLILEKVHRVIEFNQSKCLVEILHQFQH